MPPWSLRVLRASLVAAVQLLIDYAVHSQIQLPSERKKHQNLTSTIRRRPVESICSDDPPFFQSFVQHLLWKLSRNSKEGSSTFDGLSRLFVKIRLLRDFHKPQRHRKTPRHNNLGGKNIKRCHADFTKGQWKKRCKSSAWWHRRQSLRHPIFLRDKLTPVAIELWHNGSQYRPIRIWNDSFRYENVTLSCIACQLTETAEFFRRNWPADFLTDITDFSPQRDGEKLNK